MKNATKVGNKPNIIRVFFSFPQCPIIDRADNLIVFHLRVPQQFIIHRTDIVPESHIAVKYNLFSVFWQQPVEKRQHTCHPANQLFIHLFSSNLAAAL